MSRCCPTLQVFKRKRSPAWILGCPPGSAPGRTLFLYTWVMCCTWPRLMNTVRVSQPLSLPSYQRIHMAFWNGPKLSPRWGMLQTLIDVICSNWSQDSDVSRQGFARAHFSIWFTLGTFPEDWVCQVEWRWHFIPKDFASPWIIWKLKEGPLSLWRKRGSPNLGRVFLRNTLTTSVAFSVWAGKDVVHPVKVSIGTNMCSNSLHGDVCVKANLCQSSQSSLSPLSTGSNAGNGLGLPGSL